MPNTAFLESTTTIGAVIAEHRRSQRITLRQVSPYVAVSTLSAIERGRVIPTLEMLDTIVAGLGLPLGALDLCYLESVRNVDQRQAVYRRLTSGGCEAVRVQRHLRRALASGLLRPRQRFHAGLLLAHLMVDRGQYRRAAVLLEHQRRWPGADSEQVVELLALLGKCYLNLKQPQRALDPLLEASHQHPNTGHWEAAMYNLGLAWWLVGHYDQARDHWLDAVKRITNQRRKGSVSFGIGNSFMSVRDYSSALQWYEAARALYRDAAAPADSRLGVLNKIMLCRCQLGLPMDLSLMEEAEQLWDSARMETRGEFTASRAECALRGGSAGEARNLARRAVDLMGDAPVLSWFTIRLLLITMDSWDAKATVEEMDARIERVSDRNLRSALRIEVLRLLLEGGRQDDAAQWLNRLAASYPSVVL
jgi:tetratricopeptide (TPR) repeat protein